MTLERPWAPGPWAVEEDMRSERVGDMYDTENGYRDYLAGWNISSPAGEIVGIEGIIPGDNAEANARLIAAAPDLYEALAPFAAMLDALEYQTNGPKTGLWYAMESSVVGLREITVEDFQAARAALAKANGETVA